MICCFFDFFNILEKGRPFTDSSKLRWVTSNKKKCTCHCNIFDHDKRQFPRPVRRPIVNDNFSGMTGFAPAREAKHAQFLRMGPETFPRDTRKRVSPNAVLKVNDLKDLGL